MSLAAFSVEWVVPLANEAFPAFVRAAVRSAAQRVWGAAFLVDARPAEDTHETVRGFLEDLGYARWKGVDTRVLVGSSPVPELRVANRTAVAFLRSLGVDAREHGIGVRHGLHGKYLVIDDHTVVIGSHNWTPRAFGRDEEDSLAIRSVDLCAHLAMEFVRRWDESEVS